MALPINRLIEWDAPANSVEAQVSSYVVKVNGQVVGTPTTLNFPYTISTPGTYTIAVSAVGNLGEGQAATLTEIFVLPGQVVNLRIVGA